MTDPDIAALRKGQAVHDDRGREWLVHHDPVLEADRQTHFVMVRRGDFAVKLTYRSAFGWRVTPPA